MKKTIILIGVLLVLWFASLFYANLKTEDNINNYLANINTIYQQKNTGINIVLNDFQSSFFGAKAQYKIKLDSHKILGFPKNTPDNRKSILIKILSKDFIINQNIKYGPLFFDNGIEFGMAKMTYADTLDSLFVNLVNLAETNSDKKLNDEKFTQFKQSLVDIFQAPVLLKINSILTFFSNKVKTNGSISKIHFLSKKNKKLELIIEPIVIKSIVNIVDLTGFIKLNSTKITIKEKAKNLVEIQNFSIDSSASKFIDIFNYDGSLNINTTQIDLYSEDKNYKTSFVADLKLGINQSDVAGFSNNNFALNLEVLNYTKALQKLSVDLPKTIQLSFGWNNINAQEIANVVRLYKDYLLSLTNNNPKALEVFNQATDHLEKAFLTQKTNFYAKIAVDTEKYKDNKIDVNLVYNFKNGELRKVFDLSRVEIIAFVKDKVEAKINTQVNENILKHFMMFLQAPLSMGIIVKKGDMYVSDINFKNAKLMVNDKDLTKVFVPK